MDETIYLLSAILIPYSSKRHDDLDRKSTIPKTGTPRNRKNQSEALSEHLPATTGGSIKGSIPKRRVPLSVCQPCDPKFNLK
jgi:hypothetical protein